MNRQDEYARCLQVVKSILKGHVDDIPKEFLKRVEYGFSRTKLEFKDAMEKVNKNCSDELPGISQEDEIEYVFCVDCANENDMVNLIYFCLANEELKGKADLCVKTEDPKLQANIKDLLCVLLNTGTIKNCYTLTDDKYIKMMNRRKTRIIRRFSPIYVIDEDLESVAYWRQSVQTFLLKLYKKIRIGSRENVYTKNYFLPHISPQVLKNKHLDDFAPKEFNQDIWLMNIFVECFCTGETKESRHSDFVEKRYKIWKSANFFEYIKDMSLLSMYIFCISDYFLKNPETDSMEQIEREIFDARDMAEGFLQILENIYHSENRRGYFCFRVHNNSEGRSKGYLGSQYQYYMSKRERKAEEKTEQQINYLEMKVADYSHCTIPDQFLRDFQKREQNAEEKDKEIYHKIQGSAKKVNVNSFFRPWKLWEDYNSIPENMVHHYGIQVFESLVLCYDGYFRLRSQEKYQINLEKEFYSSIKNKKSPEERKRRAVFRIRDSWNTI